MKLRALHEAEWGWKQRGTASPKYKSGVDPERMKLRKAEYEEAEDARRAASDTADPVDYYNCPKCNGEGDVSGCEHCENRGYFQRDIGQELLDKQAKIKKVRVAKAFGALRPLVQFPEDKSRLARVVTETSKEFSRAVIAYRRQAVKELRRDIGELMEPVKDSFHRVRSEFKEEWYPYLEEADELIGGGLGGEESYWNDKFEKARNLVDKVKALRREQLRKRR